jgi:menaquinone-9 beta-reductase
MAESTMSKLTGGEDYDTVIVGASLAGCATAILLARAGSRVALVEQRSDPVAYKKMCSHYIQSSAVPTLERLELLEPMLEAGAVRSGIRINVPAGWIVPPADGAPEGVNLRRERLDPLIREMAVATPGVELFAGWTAEELIRDDGAVRGIVARDTAGERLRLNATLVVGADGRGSRVAKLAGVRSRTVRHGRIAYGAYFEGGAPEGAPAASLWMLDPDMAAAFPTDEGLTFYAAMPVKEHAAAFREDPARALLDTIRAIPDAPPIDEARMVSKPQGKLDMTNVANRPVAPGLALVGDAALAIDPLWGVGCGWALQSAEWLADSVAPALAGSEPLARGLRRYRRRHARALRGHALMMYDYAGGRRMRPVERMLFTAATYDDAVAGTMEAFGSRRIGPARMLLTATPRAAAATIRRRLSRRAPSAGERASAGPGAAAVEAGAGRDGGSGRVPA